MEVIAIAALVAIVLLSKTLFRRRPRRRRPSRGNARVPWPRRESGRRSPRTIAGKAYVTDGDGIRVSRQEIRFAGIDAPEWDQPAKHRDGYWFAHGKRVKSALIREIGGRHVRVAVEDYDKFGRAVGTVTCDGRDIGEWLVREGHASAARGGGRYERAEREAREAGRGMWAQARDLDPGHGRGWQSNG